MAGRSPAALVELYDRIGYAASDKGLIQRALTHASHGASGRRKDYERLEFLGDRVLAEACEALLGAIYLDGGLEPARSFILRHWSDLLERAAGVGKDAKTALQEWALSKALPVPVYYEETRSGPDHLPIFVMMAEVEGYEPAPGEGPSKRVAEQMAATAFLVREGVWK